MKLSQRAYAQYRKERGLKPWSRGAVRLAVTQGTIKVDASGRVDSAQADAAMDGVHVAQADQERTTRATTRTGKTTGPPTRRPDGSIAREIWRQGVQDAAVVTYGILAAVIAAAAIDTGLTMPQAVAVGRLAVIWWWGEMDSWLGEQMRLPEPPATIHWDRIAADGGVEYDPQAIKAFWKELNERLEARAAGQEGGN